MRVGCGGQLGDHLGDDGHDLDADGGELVQGPAGPGFVGQIEQGGVRTHVGLGMRETLHASRRPVRGSVSSHALRRPRSPVPISRAAPTSASARTTSQVARKISSVIETCDSTSAVPARARSSSVLSTPCSSCPADIDHGDEFLASVRFAERRRPRTADHVVARGRCRAGAPVSPVPAESWVDPTRRCRFGVDPGIDLSQRVSPQVDALELVAPASDPRTPAVPCRLVLLY